MATKRLTNYEKALNRALKLQRELLVDHQVTERRIEASTAAWNKVIALHWTPDHDAANCAWCERYPSLFE